MKLFKGTVECYPNNCYVETLLIVADDINDAEKQIKTTNKGREAYGRNALLQRLGQPSRDNRQLPAVRLRRIHRSIWSIHPPRP